MSKHPLDQVTLGGLIIVRDKMLAQAAAGRKVYRLEAGDPSFDTPPHVRQAIIEALESGKTHYPPSTGLPALRAAMLTKLHQENHLPIRDAEHVVVTVGGMQALYLTFASLCDPGDEVIMPDPMWGEVHEFIQRVQAVPVQITLEPDKGFLYDPAAIEAAVTERTRAIYINSPHNPTGAMLTEEQMRQIADLAIRRNLAVISDEAYEHVVYDGNRHVSIGSLPGMADRTVSVFTFSKTYAMTGLRLGYLATNDDALLGRMRKLLRMTTAGVSSIIQYGGLAALIGPQETSRQMMAELAQRRDIFYAGLKPIPVFQAWKPQGAFYMWTRISDEWPGYQGARDSWAMTNYLIDQAGIGSTPGITFGPSGERYIRFAFAGATDQLVEALEIMQDLFK